MVSSCCKRVYLFRGKSLDNGEWIFGSLMIANDKYFIIPQIAKAMMTCSVEIDPGTASQYVMGEDRHGNELFEGDIVNVYDRHFNKIIDVAMVCDKSTLIHDGGGFWKPQDTVRLEVIGNIWDNLELLDERTRRWIDNYYRVKLFQDSRKIKEKWNENGWYD